MNQTLLALSIASLVSLPAMAQDFGVRVEQLLNAQSMKYFGIVRPLAASAEGSVARAPGQDAYDLIELAQGLRATILTREAGNSADMFAAWPNAEDPSHLIFCIEGGRQDLGATLPSGITKYNPSVQAISLEDGSVRTLLRGMDRCDGIRTTAWGTVLATEETDDGRAYEIIDPLGFGNYTVADRATGAIIDAEGNPATDKVAQRADLPTMAWEGLTVTAEGVVIGGDELRPGTAAPDVDGGAIFKFVPSLPHAGGMIGDLADSPLAAGASYAMQVSCRDNKQQYGQGCEVGNAAWVPVAALNARSSADANGATGYYRPEDLHADPTYTGPGLRFCWTNTGNEGAGHYAEVVCGVDSDPLAADGGRSVVVNRFVEGDTDFNSFDNLAFQPGTGNLYVVEDHGNGDVFACLPDGADRDIKSDGCVRVLSVKDQSAEPTGFGFIHGGRTAVMNVQHSDDSNMPSVDDYGTDDILVITGFRR